MTTSRAQPPEQTAEHDNAHGTTLAVHTTVEMNDAAAVAAVAVAVFLFASGQSNDNDERETRHTQTINGSIHQRLYTTLIAYTILLYYATLAVIVRSGSPDREATLRLLPVRHSIEVRNRPGSDALWCGGTCTFPLDVLLPPNGCLQPLQPGCYFPFWGATNQPINQPDETKRNKAKTNSRSRVVVRSGRHPPNVAAAAVRITLVRCDYRHYQQQQQQE